MYASEESWLSKSLMTWSKPKTAHRPKQQVYIPYYIYVICVIHENCNSFAHLEGIESFMLLSSKGDT